MARPPRFTDDDVLDAALAAVARHRHETTVAQVAIGLGGPVGSIYHRFRSRDELLLRLWLRSVRRFQAGLFELAAATPPSSEGTVELAVALALHIPRYCRRHRDEAVALTLHRQSRLLEEGCPEELRPEVAGLNAGVDDLARELAVVHYGRVGEDEVTLVHLATRIGPYGLVRPWLGGPVPDLLDDAVAAQARAILGVRPAAG